MQLESKPDEQKSEEEGRRSKCETDSAATVQGPPAIDLLSLVCAPESCRAPSRLGVYDATPSKYDPVSVVTLTSSCSLATSFVAFPRVSEPAESCPVIAMLQGEALYTVHVLGAMSEPFQLKNDRLFHFSTLQPSMGNAQRIRSLIDSVSSKISAEKTLLTLEQLLGISSSVAPSSLGT